MLEAQINLNGPDCQLLFPTPRGRLWRERTFYRDLWKPAQEASGMDIRPHECRHSYVTQLRARGKIPDADLADIVGHRVQTLLARYTHAVGGCFSLFGKRLAKCSAEQYTHRLSSVSKNPKTKQPLNEQSPDAADLRRRVRAELRASGFVTEDGRLRPREEPTKQAIRDLHKRQRTAILKKSRPFIDRWEDKLLEEFANGDEIEPQKIRPVVTRVDGEGLNAALFRFATLHWTVPVSVGYGRRTRFLVRDENTEKLIGVFALGDPVYNLRVRDREIGWGVEQRSARLYNVLDAFVLGAVPPYRELLGGKLIAMAATSLNTNELITDKYKGTQTRISQKTKDPRPVLVTTTSALGRSSLFNRLKYRNRLLYRPIGYTEGFGHFQFSDSLFAELCDLLRGDGGIPDYEYGGGPNWRLRTIRQALGKLDIEDDLLRHGVQRQVFLAPLAINWRQYLRGEVDIPRWYRLHLNEMAAFYRRRWAVPRAKRDESYREVSRERMRLSSRSGSR